MDIENENLAADAGVPQQNSVGTDLTTFELPPVSEQATDFKEKRVLLDDSENLTPDDDNIHAAETEATDGGLAAEGAKYRGTLSTAGEVYDPSVHHIPPSETKGGKWRKMSPKQKRELSESGGNAGKTEAPLNNAAYRRSATKYASMYGSAHTIPFGKGGVINKEELAPLVDDIERYIMENDIGEMSAGWGVLFSAVNYTAAVCQRESNAEKVARWLSGPVNWIKEKMGFDVEQEKEDKGSA